MRTEPGGVERGLRPLQLWATPPRAAANSSLGRGFGDSPGGILDGPYLPSFIPPSSPPVKCEPRPLETNLQPEEGHTGTPRSCRDRSISLSPGAGAQGRGKALPPVSQAPSSCPLDPHPGALPLALAHPPVLHC
uniref:Uncharacterized protein n=1 Tax=Pipistrellus kuhlii TaxID=59472 RepID=A0A7J7YXH9_PIPKU|nr:hypothetical protein mPipKuh1_009931 [Pipistrellus kuhlii]